MVDKKCPEITRQDQQSTDPELDKLRSSTIEVMRAMDRGLTAKEATLLVKNKSNLCKEAERKINAKYRKWSLASPAMQKAAHLAISDTLAMRPLITSDGKEIFPSHTNRLAAAAMVADRVEPVVRQSLNLNLNADIAPVDLDRYR